MSAIAGFSGPLYGHSTLIAQPPTPPMQRRDASRHPNQIRRYRRRRNLKLWQVAKLAGLRAPSHLSHWETGQRVPSLANALYLSAIIQCPVEVLFFELFADIRRDIRTRKENLDSPAS